MKKIKENIKVYIAFIIGLIVSSGIVYATSTIASSNISYSNTTSGLAATNVQDSIDQLYAVASSTFLDRMYPIGSIYISTTLSSASAVSNALGGTWEAYGNGRTLVGVDTTQTEFNTINKTGGEKTHTLTINEMPSHNHDVASVNTSSPHTVGIYDSQAVNNGYWSSDFTATYAIPIQCVHCSVYGHIGFFSTPTGGSQSHNNLQPYITVYMYRRTA